MIRINAKICIRIVLVLLALALMGCDDVLDCIDDDQPELRPNSLPNPVLNQEYDQVIRASIRNEPYDDRFDYSFTFRGDLPSGIQTEADDRDFKIYGTATQMGDFEFTVTVMVDGNLGDYNDTSGLCTTIDSEVYQWSVQPL
ncbi:MAG: hypothetical protein KTR35_20025 [Gammaproteobacteria bacterium]|nr:hypothetical protein [Gammaproteobacteria bacterium]